uniref:Uncharacterized protein n=1 Tax=Daphnia magna TaxID=35525 RepID=A0A0P6DS01_9CRUS
MQSCSRYYKNYFKRYLVPQIFKIFKGGAWFGLALPNHACMKNVLASTFFISVSLIHPFCTKVDTQRK